MVLLVNDELTLAGTNGGGVTLVARERAALVVDIASLEAEDDNEVDRGRVEGNKPEAEVLAHLDVEKVRPLILDYL